VRRLTMNNTHATHIEHFENENQSVLVFASSNGKISGLDLRSMKIVWEMQSPANYGDISSLLLGGNRSWIMTGTHRGVLSLYDIRFNILLVGLSKPRILGVILLDHVSINLKHIP
jgi:phosphoinositide-3-kinase, regulatory subunit 4